MPGEHYTGLAGGRGLVFPAATVLHDLLVGKTGGESTAAAGNRGFREGQLKVVRQAAEL